MFCKFKERQIFFTCFNSSSYRSGTNVVAQLVDELDTFSQIVLQNDNEINSLFVKSPGLIVFHSYNAIHVKLGY